MSNQVTQSIIVNRKTPDVYRIWANFESFPQFMDHIKAVRKTGEHTSHWTMEGPLGFLVAWEVEMTAKEENKRLAWSSKDKAGDVKTSGQVTFTALPQDQTEVTVTLRYVPPKGVVGDMVADWFVSPESRLRDDLKNFKAYAEGMFERGSLLVQKGV